MNYLGLLLTMLLPGPPWDSPRQQCGTATESVLIPTGSHRPFMSAKDTLVAVPAFYMDKFPVTNAQFLEFVKKHPTWQKEKIKPLFADSGYLKHWQGVPSQSQLQTPVTYVSWYTAQAYCECQGKRLPTIYQWEYAASFYLLEAGTGRQLKPEQVVLRWYSAPKQATLPVVGVNYKNELGVYDMHGLIWEWVFDFNSVMLPKDARNDKELEKLYCAAGALGAADPSDYASFLRFSLRSSLKANYTLQKLGFRCVKEK